MMHSNAANLTQCCSAHDLTIPSHWGEVIFPNHNKNAYQTQTLLPRLAHLHGSLDFPLENERKECNETLKWQKITMNSVGMFPYIHMDKYHKLK